MGKQRKFGLAVRVALVVAIAAFGLAVAASGAGADDPQVDWVKPTIDYACTSGSNLTTVWGYQSTGSAVAFGPSDPGDDSVPTSDGDNDDDFFNPTASPVGDIGQPRGFAANTTAHNVFTTTAPAGLSWTLGNQTTTSSAPQNCPTDLAVSITDAVNDAVTPGSITVGFPDTYTVTAKNNGPFEADGVVVTDALTLPGTTPAPTATPSVGTCSGTAPITCNLGHLGIGVSATIKMTITPNATGPLVHNANISSPQVADTTPSNNNASFTSNVNPQGGSSGGGIVSAGQQIKVADPAVNGTIKVTTGTLALTTDVNPCPTNIATISCKSEALNMVPHGTPNGQIVTEVFDSGRPSPFIPIWKVKFFYFKNDNIDHPMPLCPHYLVPNPGPSGNVCEYFRYMNLQGHAIVFLAVGANDARSHR